MAYNESAYKASQKYKAAHIKRIPFEVQIEDYERIKAAADKEGLKVNSFIKQILFAYMKKEDEKSVCEAEESAEKS